MKRALAAAVLAVLWPAIKLYVIIDDAMMAWDTEEDK